MEEIKEQSEAEITSKKKKTKSFRRGVITGILSCLLVVVLVLGAVAFALRGTLSSLKGFNISKLQYIASLVQHYYYEDIDDEALTEGIYKGYRSEGMPHSTL